MRQATSTASPRYNGAAPKRMKLASTGQRFYRHLQTMSGSDPACDEDQRLIYLVDDEEMMLNIAEAILAANGYRLKKFLDPMSALDSFSREPHKPALLLTDYNMSPIDGVELSARCKSEHPELKVLIVSGTAGPDIVIDRPDTVDRFLTKPYQLAELVDAVRALLGPGAV